jgi:hypothetical protein
MLEATIRPPTLIRDTQFLQTLENHYAHLLDYAMTLTPELSPVSLKPSLSLVRNSLLLENVQILSWIPVEEKSEDDTSTYHRKMLEPLVKLARVCLADGGASLTGLMAEDLDRDLISLHPKITSRTHRGSQSEATKPDHSIIGEHQGKITTLVCVEDKNTTFGNTKQMLLEDLVGTKVTSWETDAAKVWKQVSNQRK